MSDRAEAFRKWLKEQEHDEDPISELYQLLETELGKQDIPPVIVSSIVGFVGMKESTFDDEINSGVSYISSKNDNENCFMIIPPKSQSKYQYTLKSFKFRITGTATFSVRFGRFDVKWLRMIN